MSVGLPGSGIGGVFYLASAVFMPISSARRALRGDAPKAGLALRQTALALSIIAALWLTGVAVEWMIMGAQSQPLRAAIGDGADSGVPSFLRAASFALTFGTLGLVLLLVQVLRLFVRPLPAESAGDPLDLGRKAA